MTLFCSHETPRTFELDVSFFSPLFKRQYALLSNKICCMYSVFDHYVSFIFSFINREILSLLLTLTHSHNLRTVNFTDGSSKTFSTRERPQLLFGDSARHVPVGMTSAVSSQPIGPWCDECNSKACSQCKVPCRCTSLLIPQQI